MQDPRWLTEPSTDDMLPIYVPTFSEEGSTVGSVIFPRAWQMHYRRICKIQFEDHIILRLGFAGADGHVWERVLQDPIQTVDVLFQEGGIWSVQGLAPARPLSKEAMSLLLLIRYTCSLIWIMEIFNPMYWLIQENLKEMHGDIEGLLAAAHVSDAKVNLQIWTCMNVCICLIICMYMLNRRLRWH